MTTLSVGKRFPQPCVLYAMNLALTYSITIFALKFRLLYRIDNLEAIRV